MRHPQFQHLEPLLRKRDFLTFKREVFNPSSPEDRTTKKLKTDSNETSNINDNLNGKAPFDYT